MKPRCASPRMLDLDHICAPVRQDRTGGGNERELGYFQDPDAFHYLRHTPPLLAENTKVA
jgi:hypothetical protein